VVVVVVAVSEREGFIHSAQQELSVILLGWNSPGNAIVRYNESDRCAHLIGAVFGAMILTCV